MIPYKPSPTLTEFHLDDRFVRGVMGPFGCTSGDTEYLSPSGWRRIDEYRGEPVGQWRDGVLEFVKPEYHEYPCDELIWFRNKNTLSMVVSEGHRMPLYDWKERFRVKTAVDVESSPSKYRVPTNFTPSFKDVPISDEMLRFMIAAEADGSNAGKRVYFSLRKERKKERLRALLDGLGIEYSEKTYEKRPTESVFSVQVEYTKNAYADPWWWTLSQRQLQIVLDECVHWDGGIYGCERRFFSNQKSAVDFIQYAAHACGARASITSQKKGGWAETFKVHIALPGSQKSVVNLTKGFTQISRVPADKMYCFTVPSSFWVARHDNKVFVTGNSGKSVGMCWEIFFRCKMMPALQDGFRHSRWVVVRNTKEQLKDTTLRTWLEWFPEGVSGRYSVSDMTYFLEYDDIRAEILFRALDKPDDVRKLLSLELTGAFVNEAREVPWAIINGLTGRVRRYPRLQDFTHLKPEGVTQDESDRYILPNGEFWRPYQSHIIMDTNPPDEDHWWYQKFEVQAKSDPQVAEHYKLFRQPPAVLRRGKRWETNPKAENLANLDPDYYPSMVVGKDPEWIKVYAEGNYGVVSDGRPVYSGYNDELHCMEFDVNPNLPVYVGWDYSFRGQACVLAQLSPRGQLRIFQEFVGEESGIGLEDFVLNSVKPGLMEWGQLDFRRSTGDPAGAKHGDLDEKFALALLNDQYEDTLMKLPFVTEPADTNSLGPRTEGVNQFMNRLIDGGPALLLHPRCAVLRKGFLGRYEFKRVQVVGEARYKDMPDKNKYSHPQDALQYLVRGILNDYEEEEYEMPELLGAVSAYSGY